MEKEKKRAWFQIHLSTAVVVMFVAGCLIWANTKERIESENDLLLGKREFEVYGWPLAIWNRRTLPTAQTELSWIRGKVDDASLNMT